MFTEHGTWKGQFHLRQKLCGNPEVKVAGCSVSARARYKRPLSSHQVQGNLRVWVNRVTASVGKDSCCKVPAMIRARVNRSLRSVLPQLEGGQVSESSLPQKPDLVPRGKKETSGSLQGHGSGEMRELRCARWQPMANVTFIARSVDGPGLRAS